MTRGPNGQVAENFTVGHVTVTTPLTGMICHLQAGTCLDLPNLNSLKLSAQYALHRPCYVVLVASCPRRRRAPRLDESVVQGVPGVEPAMHRCSVLLLMLLRSLL